MGADSITSELASPDRVGSLLARFRTRAYRFTDDPELYVLAEHLEERFIQGHSPMPATLDFVRSSLASIREHGRVPQLDPAVVSAEGLDVREEMLERRRFAYRNHVEHARPEQIVFIVGAPRSGTSHLFNLLAYQCAFAYFTTASCWAWPIRNLHHPARRLFTAVEGPVLQVDNRLTRLIPGLVMPGEAEDVYARAIPVYRHVAGHRYEILAPRVGDRDVLLGGVGAHLSFFDRSRFLTKSPFNSFRIPELLEMFGSSARFVHIVRGRSDTAASMRRNAFEFQRDGELLTPEEAWSLFTSAVLNAAPADLLLSVTHADLLAKPLATLLRILEWLGLPPTPRRWPT